MTKKKILITYFTISIIIIYIKPYTGREYMEGENG
jgi:hypothetical protein